MVFSSALFLFLFLPLVLLGSFVFRGKSSNALLAAASLFFYVWGETRWAPIFLCSILANYFVGLRLSQTTRKRFVLGVGVALNLSTLAYFKYADFAYENLARLLRLTDVTLPARAPTHLPIGISFFTFHAISYLIDVKRAKVQPQRSLIDFTLYMSLFPQLVAGPIVRYHEINWQLDQRQTMLSGFADGVRRFVIGLAKKILIANTLAVQADAIFAIPSSELTPVVAWLGAVFYTFQIYFDFSAYSDMAIGLGHMFGFTLPENFNYPYISQSITELWRRWHMSLSRFFRDYVYIPLGGNKQGEARTYRNLLVVFFLCGLWHGASWTFVVWGLYHGAFLIIERRGLSRVLERLPAPLRHAYLLLTVIAGWVFFRADTLSAALLHLGRMAGIGAGNAAIHHASLYFSNDVSVALVLAVIGSAPVVPWLQSLGDRPVEVDTQPARAVDILAAAAGTLAVLALLVASAAWLASGTYNPFIYFRF